eukprot:297530-Rhodomonas_salina.1
MLLSGMQAGSTTAAVTWRRRGWRGARVRVHVTPPNLRARLRGLNPQVLQPASLLFQFSAILSREIKDDTSLCWYKV